MGIGAYRHTVTFQNPGAQIPDGDGGWTQDWTDLVPATWKVSIKRAGLQDLERFTAATVVNQAAYVVRGRYHKDVSTNSRMLFDGRKFSIVDTLTEDERKIDMAILAIELKGATA